MNNHWEIRKLGDCLAGVVDNRGKTPPTSTEINDGCELLEINSISGNGKHPNYSLVTKFVSKEVYAKWFRSGHPKIDDILFATVGTVGEVAILNENRGCIAQNLIALRPNKDILNPNYLFYFLVNPLTKAKLLKLNISYVQPSIRVPHFLATDLPLPPLSEQQRIVTILDKVFAALLRAKENAEKNLQNAKELFRNYLLTILRNKGKHWEMKKLSEIADYFIGLTYSPKDVSNTGTIVLRSSNVQKGKLDFSDIVRVDRPIKDSLKVKAGDILMCSRNGSKRLVGKTATIQDLEEEMTFGTFMTVFRSKYNPYLSWFFKSDEFRAQIGAGESTMINQITKYMLDDISVPLPPLSEQQTIVSRLETLSAETQRLESIYQQKLAALEMLKKSLLHQAFNGELSGATV